MTSILGTLKIYVFFALMKKLSEEEKKCFQEDCFKQPSLSERELAKKYNISKGSVSRLKKALKNLDECSDTGDDIEKIQFFNEFSNIDNQCFEVFLRLRKSGVPIGGTALKSIAIKQLKKWV